MDAGEYLDIEVRTAEQIARRIIALYAVVQRVAIEGAGAQDLDEALFDLRAMLALSGAAHELMPAESALIASQAGQISEDDRYAFAWEIETLSAILATTGLIDALPPPPEPGDLAAIDALFEDQEPNVGNLTGAIRIPDDESAAREREIAELWLWRATIERELRDSQGPERAELQTEIREVASEAAATGLFDLSSTEDFDTGHRSIAAWTDDELAAFELAAESRLRALNWLCGLGKTWDEVPVEV